MASNYGIQFKRTTIPESLPERTQIVEGELAINLADKKLYTKFNNEIINIGFDYDQYVGNNFLARSGGPLTGLLSFDISELPTVDDDIATGSNYNLVHKGYVASEVQTLNSTIEDRLPANSITIWGNADTNTIPDGWAECDGGDSTNPRPNINPIRSAVGTTEYVYIIKL